MHTEKSLFSPNSIDKGTLTMLSKVDFQPGQKILDLGCGYGVIGIYAAHFSGAENVTMVDINPPYHANFDVPKNFIEGGLRHLKHGGRMVMVTKRYQWYKNKLEDVFGGVTVIEDNDYYIFISEKRAVHKTQEREKQKLSKKLQRKYGRTK